MGSTGKGRLYRVRRYPTLRGRLGLPDVEAPARVVANDTFWGGFAPAPTLIPYDWLTPPARWRSDQPRNVALISRASGSTARSVNATSVAAVGERQFTATLDTKVIDDPQAYADWIVGNYTSPRQRMPQVRLNLLSRTPTECWRILERRIGDRISITGAPAATLILNANPYFETDASSWTPVGGATTVAQTTGQRHEGAASLLLTPDGTVGSVEANSEFVPTVPGAGYRATAWIWSAVTRNVMVGLNWYNAAGGFVADTLPAGSATVTAATWTLFDVPATAPAGAVQAKLFTSMSGTPPASNTLNIDEAKIIGPNPTAWPAGITELVIEGIEHSIDSAGTRWVVWNTAPLVGAQPGQAGPWFRADQSMTDGGTDVLAF